MNKAHLKRLALEVRNELSLGPLDVLDPYVLAEDYGIDVYRLGEYEGVESACHRFLVERVEAFSGALIPDGCGGASIIENDAHSPERRRATMGHEMAHVVCEHTFSAALVNERGCRLVDSDAEREAAELGAELLIPFDAARTLAWRSASDEEVAAHFQVSIPFARWRMNASGARKIVQRSLAQRARQTYTT